MNDHVAASASASAFVPSPRRFIRASRMRHIIHLERRSAWNTSPRNTYATQSDFCKRYSWDQPTNNGWWKQSTHFNGN